MHRNFMRIVQESVLAGPLRAEDVARAIGKPYPTFMRELNPYDSGAKLGVETLLRVMHVTRDYTPLEFLAEQFDLLLMPAVRPGETAPCCQHNAKPSC